MEKVKVSLSMREIFFFKMDFLKGEVENTWYYCAKVKFTVLQKQGKKKKTPKVFSI